MKRVRYLTAVVIAAALVLSSCAGRKAVSDDGVHIVATFYPIYIMCLNITDGADGVSLVCLAPPGTGCLHDYSLTTRDAAALEKADIIVANGAGMESFLGSGFAAVTVDSDSDEGRLRRNDGKGVPPPRASRCERGLSCEGVARSNPYNDEKKVIAAAEGYPLIDGNPHIFVSVAGARHEVKVIARALERLDSERADIYAANAARYDKALSELAGEMHTALDPYRGRSMVTFHEAFPYFAAEFGFDILSVIEREPGTAPSAREIAQTVRVIREDIASGRIPALFAEPQYPSSSAAVIHSETGLEVHSLDPCVTGPITRDAYIQAQKQNALVLAAAWGAARP